MERDNRVILAIIFNTHCLCFWESISIEGLLIPKINMLCNNVVGVMQLFCYWKITSCEVHSHSIIHILSCKFNENHGNSAKSVSDCVGICFDVIYTYMEFCYGIYRKGRIKVKPVEKYTSIVVGPYIRFGVLLYMM